MLPTFDCTGHYPCNLDGHCVGLCSDGVNSLNCLMRLVNSLVKGPMTFSGVPSVMVLAWWLWYFPCGMLVSCLLKGKYLIKWLSLPHLKQAFPLITLMSQFSMDFRFRTYFEVQCSNLFLILVDGIPKCLF